MGNPVKQYIITTGIHATAWMLFFLLPIFIVQYSSSRNEPPPMPLLTLPIAYLIAFYTNYFILIDRFLFKRKTVIFLLLNLVLVFVLCTGLYILNEIAPFHGSPSAHKPPHAPFLLSVIRDAGSIICFIGLSTGLKTVMLWRKVESKNRKLEQERAEAELKNLKSQLNPHFLFNTLNNIYALIAIDRDRAQKAVLELSRLLRYVLYENKERFVPIEQEINFLQDYIEVMRLRQNRQTHIDVNIDISQCTNCRIAPLLFIPLIENAFKHGIDTMQKSFIEIEITSPSDGTICCRVRNSYFPKNGEDHSGSGIGLDNIRRQLDLLYPQKYHFETTCIDNVFCATLSINLHKTT